MDKETDVTIVSTNLNKNILTKYPNYHVIENNFNMEDLCKYTHVIFYNNLNNLSEKKVKEIFTFLKNNYIKFINITNNMEFTLLTTYLIIYDRNNILIEGPTLEVLKNTKLIKRIGLNLPFMVDLSLLLKDYNLLDKIYLDKEELRGVLWP